MCRCTDLLSTDIKVTTRKTLNKYLKMLMCHEWHTAVPRKCTNYPLTGYFRCSTWPPRLAGCHNFSLHKTRTFYCNILSRNRAMLENDLCSPHHACKGGPGPQAVLLLLLSRQGFVKSSQPPSCPSQMFFWRGSVVPQGTGPGIRQCTRKISQYCTCISPLVVATGGLWHNFKAFSAWRTTKRVDNRIGIMLSKYLPIVSVHAEQVELPNTQRPWQQIEPLAQAAQ